MKPMFFICLALLFSCSLKNEKQRKAADISEIKAEKKIAIRVAGELTFRRTFAEIQFIDNEKERDEYVARQEKSNPWLVFSVNKDSSLLNRFKKLGIVKNEELLEQQFEYDTLTSFQITDGLGKEIKIQIARIPGGSDHKIIASSYQDSTEAIIKTTSLEEVKYALMDIIPGGNKEIVVLDEYYIMNGYNFDLMVYEIKI
jgi:hypothetical protein